MNLLLASETFSGFGVAEVVLKKDYTMELDGTKASGDADGGRYVSYGDIRPLLFEHLKGSKLPSLFRVVLCRDAAQVLPLISKEPGSTMISLFLIRIEYTGETLDVISGVSYDTFSMEKDVERAWDDRVRNFLTAIEVDFDD